MSVKPGALVTGASSGIGRVTADKMIAAGYRVYGTRRRDGLARDHAFPLLTLDVTNNDSVTVAMEELLRREGRIICW